MLFSALQTNTGKAFRKWFVFVHFLRIFVFLRLMYLSENKLVTSTPSTPFGTPLYNRGFSFSGGYKYGYQGSEKDNEIKGNGNSYTTEFRGLDVRLGRWLSIDPMNSSNPWTSPYISMDNKPIVLTDIFGNTVDVSSVSDPKNKQNLKEDLEAKTGYTLKEVTDKDGVSKVFKIDNSKGIKRDENGKKIGSREARMLLKAAIKSEERILVDDGHPEVETAETRGNFVRLNFSDIAENMKNTSSGLNPTTFGYALVFFHEIQHTSVFPGLSSVDEDAKHPKFWKSPIDANVNRIRRQLGSNYGQRQTYSALHLPNEGNISAGTNKSFMAMDKQSLKDLKNKQVPTGQFIWFSSQR